MPEITYLEAIRHALRGELQRDPDVVIFGEGIGRYGGVYGQTKGLFAEFGPTRLIDTPISEAGWVGMGLGAAITGVRPVLDIMYVDFCLVAFDQIANHVANVHYMSGGQFTAPIVICASMGAIRSSGVQHSQILAPMFMHIPGLKVIVPATPRDLVGLLRSAIRGQNPVIVLQHKALYTTKGDVSDGDFVVSLGVADIKRVGTDVTVVATAHMVVLALDAAQQLAAEGLSVEVVDPRTLVPLDTHTILESVRKTGRLVVVDESHLTCGVGAEIATVVLEHAFPQLRAPIKRIQTLDVPIAFSPPLEGFLLPNVEKIVAGIRQVYAATPVER
jgi:pyruvate/2-oxoglutarate/acetoin dehydrogenase E1 component